MMLAENELPLFERPAAATGVDANIRVSVNVKGSSWNHRTH